MKDYYLVNPNDLIHYGTKRHSGRYPYGSGERPYQGEEKKSNNLIIFDRNIVNPPIRKEGETTTLHQDPIPKTAQFLAKIFPNIKKTLDNYKDYTIRDENGKNVGNLSISKEKKSEVNIIWLGIKDQQKGYGTSAMRTIIYALKNSGINTITLEVPTNSPNAKHIYEKLGFKETGEQMIGELDDVWGGLTKMRLEMK